MIKVTFLGTCSGTEPQPNRHHCSLVIEMNGIYYWFDAGENCSHKAYTSGIDVNSVRAVFISHMHIDHIGGLANLMSVIRKVSKVTGIPHINDNCYDIFVPDLKIFEAVRVVSGTPVRASFGVNSIPHEYSDGLVFEDENIRVTALHNTHLKENGEKGWHSYSFLIEAEGKRIIFSGDVGYPAEIEPYLDQPCDLCIMETGHHSVSRVCEYASSKQVKKLAFTHHGREILRDVKAAEDLVSTFDIDACICHDGDVITLD